MYLTTMDKETILNSINSDISAFVSDKFTDYISLKVKEEIEKEKALFLEGLNVSQEEFPVFDEEKHEHFKGIKIVNDPDIPVQKESARKYELLDTEDEFILSGIKIDNDSLDITIQSLTRFRFETCEFFITNKGNIYNKNGHANCGCTHPQLFNYKILEFIKYSGCHECSKKLGGTCNYRQWSSNIGFQEMAIDRFWKSDIYKECDICKKRLLSYNEDFYAPPCATRNGGAKPVENKTINPEILRNPPMFNNEYIEILTLLSKKNFTIPIYQFQTIYAKYHPRANENSLMETKIKHLSDIENRVTDAVKTERDILTKQIEDYENKHTILQNDIEKMSSDKENFQKDILALKVMNKHAEEKLRQKSIEKNNHYNKWAQDVKLKLDDREKQLNDKALKLDENTDESKEYLQKLLKIALVINEANDKIDDKFSISDDLFSIVRELNTMVENENVLPTSFDKIAGYIEPIVESKIHSKAIQENGDVVASLKTSNNWLDSDDDILDSD